MASNSSAKSQAASNSSSSGLSGFLHGIWNGVKNLGNYLTDPKHWLLIAGVVGLCMVCPWAGVGLCALGVGTGLLSMGKGFASGNMEEAGEGAFNAGISAAGLYGSWSAVNAAKGVGSAEAGSGALTDAVKSGSTPGDGMNTVINRGWTVINNGSSAETLNDIVA